MQWSGRWFPTAARLLFAGRFHPPPSPSRGEEYFSRSRERNVPQWCIDRPARSKIASEQRDPFDAEPAKVQRVGERAGGLQHLSDSPMIFFDASHREMRTKRFIFRRKPHGHHGLIDLRHQNGQHVNVSSDARPQRARTSCVRKGSAPPEFNVKRRTFGDHRFDNLMNFRNLPVRRLTKEFQGHVEVVVMNP